MYKRFILIFGAVLFAATVGITVNYAQDEGDSETDRATAMAQYEIGWRKSASAEERLRRASSEENYRGSVDDYNTARRRLAKTEGEFRTKYGIPRSGTLDDAPLSDHEREQLLTARTDYEQAKTTYDGNARIIDGLKKEKQDAEDMKNMAAFAYQKAGGSTDDDEWLKMMKRMEEELSGGDELARCSDTDDGW